MDAWIIWLVAACVLGVAEMHQGGFYLAPFAVGALLAAVVGLLGVGAALSAIVFGLASGMVFAPLRPVARRHRHLPPPLPTRAPALAGRPAIAPERIANDEGPGCVRIHGDGWTARSL